MSATQSQSIGLPKRRSQPVVRLDSLKNPQPRPVPQAKKPPSECPNLDCGETGTGVEEDGKTICGACGSVITEMTMVSEVTYGLASGGAHVVHGYHVGANQAYAKRGEVVDRNRAMSSREVTIANGHKYMVMIGIALQMSPQLRDSGDRIFALCVQGFIQGRRTKSVAAVALYIACRTQSDSNKYMLIDFADILDIDVFSLGNIYKAMLEHIRLNGTGVIVAPINPEDLILRFCEKLEFGRETMKVAKDAVRIVQRMNRDWMTPGRRPAGICGAALILAARMNNFRRSVREVVYVVKVQEQTILHRLDEFKGTESSALTVEEFRRIDLERSADPPIFTQQQTGKDVTTKRGRKRKHLDFDDDGDNNLPTVISSRASSATPSNINDQLNTPAQKQQKSHIDSQNMPPPPLPIDPDLIDIPGTGPSSPRAATEPATEIRVQDPSLTPGSSTTAKPTSETPSKKRRGRPPKNVSAVSGATPLTDDPALDADITAALTDPTNIDHANALTSALGSLSNPTSPPTTQVESTDEVTKKRPPIPNSEEIFDSEFCDDPEVNNCLLSPSEVAIKTRIWTHENRDYIRAQTAKALKQQLAEEAGTARVIVRRKRKRKRMGDMTAYGLDGDEVVPVAGSPEEAVMEMMKRRAYSKKLNYGIIKDLYQTSSSGASSRRGSSVLAQSPGSGFEVSGTLDATSPGGAVKRVDEPGEEAVEVESEAGDQDKDEQQKELESIAGALEDGIDEDDDEVREYGDDDPYDDGGNYSD